LILGAKLHKITLKAERNGNIYVNRDKGPLQAYATEKQKGGKSQKQVVLIRNFFLRFCNSFWVFDTQKFEVVTSKGHKVTIDKSAFIPCTDRVCAWYRYGLYRERSATFLRPHCICRCNQEKSCKHTLQ